MKSHLKIELLLPMLDYWYSTVYVYISESGRRKNKEMRVHCLQLLDMDLKMKVSTEDLNLHIGLL